MIRFIKSYISERIWPLKDEERPISIAKCLFIDFYYNSSNETGLIYGIGVERSVKTSLRKWRAVAMGETNLQYVNSVLGMTTGLRNSGLKF